MKKCITKKFKDVHVGWESIGPNEEAEVIADVEVNVWLELNDNVWSCYNFDIFSVDGNMLYHFHYDSELTRKNIDKLIEDIDFD